jgi:L-histidine Nalpha-methyltransferase
LMRSALGPGDLLLLGADLVKPVADLIQAYDDPLGVTAAFNKNLLVRINRELGGNFDLAAFAHRADWNAPQQRVEMKLVSQYRQEVRISSVGLSIDFAPGETIWTESSYKYTEAAIADLGTNAGFSVIEQWIETDARFALTLFGAN